VELPGHNGKHRLCHPSAPGFSRKKQIQEIFHESLTLSGRQFDTFIFEYR